MPVQPQLVQLQGDTRRDMYEGVGKAHEARLWEGRCPYVPACLPAVQAAGLCLLQAVQRSCGEDRMPSPMRCAARPGQQ
jgi:hypothetical protein